MADYCRNHPTVETNTLCARCSQPFCDACTVELLGQRYCAPCRDMRVAEMQGHLPGQVAAAPLAGTGTVDMGRWLSSGWQIIKDDVFTFAIAALVGGLMALVTCGILAGVTSVGLTMMAFRKMTYGRVEVGNLFDGFRRAAWAILGGLLVWVGSGAVSFLIQLPTTALQIWAQAQQNTGLALVLQLINWVLSVGVGALIAGATFFMMPHIAARNANPIDALGASFQVFRRNILMFSVAGLVFQLVALLGLVACGIGGLVTAPLVIAATAQAYADHFGIEGWDRV